MNDTPSPLSSVDVGARLRTLRTEHGLSLRALAELSQLNVNTLSLIENGKTSPSVSTSQQLAMGLQVLITAFFASDAPQKTSCSKRPGSANGRPLHAEPWKAWVQGWPFAGGNQGAVTSISLLLLCPSDEKDRPQERYF